MRIIVSGGGTGGHIYPAITLINNIKKLVPNAEFLYVGTKRVWKLILFHVNKFLLLL